MGSRHASLFASVLGLFAGIAAAAVFLMTAGEWIILMTHYEWCLPDGCSEEFRWSAYAVVLAGCLAICVLAFWGTRKLIARLER
jgi:hypothetical protein